MANIRKPQRLNENNPDTPTGTSSPAALGPPLINRNRGAPVSSPARGLRRGAPAAVRATREQRKPGYFRVSQCV